MNLDLMFMASELTGNSQYAAIAEEQAEIMMSSHVRPDYTTYHVVDFNQDGTIKSHMTHQGESLS